MKRPGSAVIISAFVFIVVTLWFIILLKADVDTDIQEHIGFVLDFVAGDAPLPQTLLFHSLVLILGGFTGSLSVAQVAAAVVLGLAFAFRYFLTYEFIREPHELSANEPAGYAWFSVGLVFAFALPSGFFYIGLYPPTVWHNPTTIVLMPFALWLFWLSSLQLRYPTPQRFWVILGLIAVNVIAKPSFLLAFLPAYPLMLIHRFGFSRVLFINCLPVVLGLVLIALMAFNIFGVSADATSSGQSGIAFIPMEMLFAALRNLPLPLLSSLAFPLVFALLYPKQAWRSELFRFAAVLFSMAMLVSLTFIETGSRIHHGNFGWGVIVCNYLLFATTVRLLVAEIYECGVRSPRNLLLTLLFSAHVLAGLHYMAIMIVEGKYWA